MKTEFIVCLALAALATSACERRLDASKEPRQNVASSSVTTTASDVHSGLLIGTTPAPPTRPEGAPPETTPIESSPSAAASSSELSTYEEARKMPLPGQPNDHSNVASDGSQRAGQTDPQSMPPRAEGSNPPQRDSQTASQYGGGDTTPAKQ